MKKRICLVLGILLCVAPAAFAMAAPSKTTSDLTGSGSVTTAAGDAVPGDIAIEITAHKTEQQANCEKLIDEIASADALEEVFGELQDEAGRSLDLAEILGTDKPVVNEVVPLVVTNYSPDFGRLKASFTFSTPYEKGQTVVVVIRVVDLKTGAVKQFVLKGVGNGVNDGIEVVFPSEVLEAVQDGTATMSVISK